MEFLRLILLVIHLFGMAALVGLFLVQMRQQSDYNLGLLLGGAVVQLVSGLALVGVLEGGDEPLNYMKLGFKLAISVGTVVTAVLTAVRQRKAANARPFFLTTGGLAVVNVLVAVLWP